MALKLKLNEMMDFEEKAGVSWVRAQTALAAKLCQMHRLQTNACKDCKAAGQLCEKHVTAFQGCGECQGAEMPARYLAPLGWLLRRRREPELTWETYIAEADGDDALTELKNA